MQLALAEVLRRPDIWRGDAIAVSPEPTLPSGFAELDAQLPGGGWPRGQLCELLHEVAGLGELSLLMPALAALTAQNRNIVLIAPPHRAHAPAWAAAGVRLERVRLVCPQQPHDVLWAGILAMRCTEVAATLIWLDRKTRLAANSLRRLHGAAGEGGGCAFLFRPASAASEASPAPLRLQLEAEPGVLCVSLLKRRGTPARRALRLQLPRPVVLRDIAPLAAIPDADSALPAVPSAPLPHAVAEYSSASVIRRDAFVA